MSPCLARVVLLILVAAGTTLAQRGRPAALSPTELAEQAKRCGTNVEWHANDPYLLEEGSNQRESIQSRAASRNFNRIEALDGALKVAAETGRLVLWYCPRISSGSNGRQMYRPAVLDGYANNVFFTDPECAELLRRRFVCVRLVCDEALGKRFRIEAPERIEPALFILGVDGQMLREVDSLRSFNATWFQELLLRSLGNEGKVRLSPAHQELVARLAKGESSAIEVAESALKEGDLKQAKELVKEFESGPSRLEALAVKIRAERRSGELGAAGMTLDSAEEALAELPPPARGETTKNDVRATLALERGRWHLLQRRLPEAARAFAGVRSGPERAEAQYWMGVCEFFQRNDQMAAFRWKDAATHKDSPFAWKAATNLVDGADRTPLGATIHGFEDVFQPAPGAHDARTTALPKESQTKDSLAREGVEFLLRLQRENGGWTDSRYAYWPTPDLTPNTWVAASALACTALLEWRHLDPERIDQALARGEAYAFDEGKMNRGFNEEIYADAYKLLYLTRKFDVTQDVGSKKAIIERMNQVIRELHRTQRPSARKTGDGAASEPRDSDDGFWSHEYPNPFSTAAVMNSLKLARERGATVPAVVMTEGAEALLTVRSPDGAFSYGAGRTVPTDPERLEKTRVERLKNSMARSPICEASLVWAGHEKGSVENVRSALKNFWEFLPRLENVRRCDFHTDGELAGFFWWHAMFHLSEAHKTLPAAERAEESKKLLEVLMRVGEHDGSFVDSHEMGKCYGTAMGLLTLSNVLSDLTQ